MAEHRHDLLGQHAGLSRCGRLAVALHGVAFLLIASDAVFGGEVLGRQAHRERSPAGAGKHLRVDVELRLHRQMVHVLHTPGELDVGLAAADCLARACDRLEPRAAEPVDRASRHAKRQAGKQGGVAGHVAAEFAVLFGCAEEHVVDRGGVDTAATHGRRERGCGEFVAADVAEAAAGGMGAADRGAAAGDDDGLVRHSL